MATKLGDLNETYDAIPANVGRARCAVARVAAAAGAAPEDIEAVRLVVSEAMTNAVVHAYDGGPGSIRVSARPAGDELLIAIADDGCGVHTRARRPGLGIGLSLIVELSDGVTIDAGACGTQLRIRFALRRPARTDPGRADAVNAPAAPHHGHGHGRGWGHAAGGAQWSGTDAQRHSRPGARRGHGVHAAATATSRWPSAAAYSASTARA